MTRKNANESKRKRLAKNLIQIWRRKKDDQPDPGKERRAWDKETDTTREPVKEKDTAEND